MTKIVRAAFPQPAEEIEKESKVDERHLSDLEDACRAIFRKGTDSTPGLEGHHAEKATKAVPVALYIDRLQLGTRRNMEWTLTLPKEGEFKLSISREPTYSDFQCVLSLLTVIKEHSPQAGPRLSESEKHAQNARRVKETVEALLIKGDDDAFLKPVPAELAEMAAKVASQSPLVRRIGNYSATAQWTFSLADGAEFKIGFAEHPDPTDLECAIDVIKIIQRRYQSAGASDGRSSPSSSIPTV